MSTVKPVYVIKRQLSKRPKIGFQGQLSLNAGQKYCRMLRGEHSAILSTFIKLSFVIKIFVLSIFEWPFHTGFTVVFGTEMNTVYRSIDLPVSTGKIKGDIIKNITDNPEKAFYS